MRTKNSPKGFEDMVLKRVVPPKDEFAPKTMTFRDLRNFLATLDNPEYLDAPVYMHTTKPYKTSQAVTTVAILRDAPGLPEAPAGTKIPVLVLRGRS